MIKSGIIQEGALGAVCKEEEKSQEEWSRMFKEGTISVKEHPHYSHEHH